jgi:hypothetical protein
MKEPDKSHPDYGKNLKMARQVVDQCDRETLPDLSYRANINTENFLLWIFYTDSENHHNYATPIIINQNNDIFNQLTRQAIEDSRRHI